MGRRAHPHGRRHQVYYGPRGGRHWVERVWRMHADVDTVASRAALERSRSFSTFLAAPSRMSLGPWRGFTWSSVISATARLRGTRGIPFCVWKLLPGLFLQRVAVLLGRAEATGEWPDELLQAYVVMIPKAVAQRISARSPYWMLLTTFGLKALRLLGLLFSALLPSDSGLSRARHI